MALTETALRPAARSPERGPALRILPQVAIVAAAIAAYFGVRGATNSDVGEAVHNATRVIHLERILHLQFQPEVQDSLADSATVRTALTWVYIWGHWPVVSTALFWLA